MAMRVVLVKGVLRHARVLVSLLPKKVSKQLSIGQFLSICYQKQYQKSSQNYRSSQNSLVYLKMARLLLESIYRISATHNNVICGVCDSTR